MTDEVSFPNMHSSETFKKLKHSVDTESGSLLEAEACLAKAELHVFQLRQNIRYHQQFPSGDHSRCVHCQQTGHKMSSCPQLEVCRKCGHIGHSGIRDHCHCYNYINAARKKTMDLSPATNISYITTLMKQKKDLLVYDKGDCLKHAYFLIPICHGVMMEVKRKRHIMEGLDLREEDMEEDMAGVRVCPECIIITSSRQSAEDIFEQTKYVIEGSALKAALASGDSSLQQQIDKAKDRCNIFITTPGRIKYFAHRKIIHFSNVKMLILNDGHQLMSNLFRECITSIVTQEDMPTVQQRQTLIFSKSLSEEIKMSSKEFLNDSYVLDMSTLLVC